MAYEPVGPGGVSNNYGVRETTRSDKYSPTVRYDEEWTPKDNTVVTAQTDPVTGGSVFSVGGNRIVAQKNGLMSLPARIIGFPAISASTNVTRHLARTLPAPFVAWRAHVHNAYAAAIDYKVALATGSSESDLYGNAAAWTKATFAGSDTASVPASSGTIPNHLFGTAISDVMYSESVAGANMLYLRTWCNTANNTRFDLSASFSGIAAHGFACAFQNGVNAVDDPTLLSSPSSHNSFPPVLLELIGANRVRKLLLCGSSTAHGQGDLGTAGWAWRTERGINAALGDYVYSLPNISSPGSTTAASLARGLKEIAEVPYDAAAYWVYSSNDTDRDTAAGHSRRKGQMIRWIQACNERGVWPVFATFQPGTWMTGGDSASYTYCKAANDYARSLAAAGLCGLLDLANFLTDETQSTPAWRNAAWTTDGIHPNTAGHAALAAWAETAVPSLFAA